MIKANLIASRNGKELHTYDGYDGLPVLVTTTHAQHEGKFASVTLAEGTQTVVEARGEEGIVLTDILISVEKVQSGTVTIQFTDAVNTISIFLISLTTLPVNLAVPLQGLWAGWQGCDIKTVSAQTVVGSVSVGYYRTPKAKTMAYAEWDASR